MKVTVTGSGLFKLEEVFNPVIFEASSGQKMLVCMRDHGFELEYGGVTYSLSGGNIKKLPL